MITTSIFIFFFSSSHIYFLFQNLSQRRRFIQKFIAFRFTLYCDKRFSFDRPFPVFPFLHIYFLPLLLVDCLSNISCLREKRHIKQVLENISAAKMRFLLILFFYLKINKLNCVIWKLFVLLEILLKRLQFI